MEMKSDNFYENKPVPKNLRYKCTVCNKFFNNKSNLNRHKANIHEGRRSKGVKFTCNICFKEFEKKFNLTRHILNKTCTSGKAQATVKCCTCGFTGLKPAVLDHYGQQHDINTKPETLEFTNIDEFESWKENMEKETISKYIRFASTKTPSKDTFYYKCHRDGYFKSKGKSIRHLKRLGSNKIGGYCPAKLDVIVHKENGTVKVEFLNSHVGHEMEVARIPLSKAERSSLAKEIVQKIPFNDIIKSVKKNINGNKIQRIHLLTRKDLLNIEQLFYLKNDPDKEASECISVQAWVTQIQSTDNINFLRFYKDHGDINVHYPELKIEDFLLIIMDDTQLGFLQKYGNECICIDSTHELDVFDFKLTTVMVLNDLRQSVPCFFIFSNRSDTTIFKIAFDVLKSCLGQLLKPKVFISAMIDSLYLAWLDVMGPVFTRLFCTWQVDRAWRKHISSLIKNSNQQASVYKNLRSLLEEPNKENFETMLHRFRIQLQTDTELNPFANFFNYYSANRKLWALCYRLDLGLHLNMHVESMYRTLKYIQVKDKTEKRLDKSIISILNFVRDKLFPRLAFMNKAKLSHKISCIRRGHKNMLAMTDSTITVNEEGGWTVSCPNFTEVIEKANVSCSCETKCADCKACIHAYVCTCFDSAVKWNMCKHIHFICNKQVPLTEEQEVEYDDDNLNIMFSEDTAPEILIQELQQNAAQQKIELDNYKTRLFEEFRNVMMSINSLEECQIMDNLLIRYQHEAYLRLNEGEPTYKYVTTIEEKQIDENLS